ncbi:MAG: family 1 encapsulin nanocompartment shell protein [Methanomicrobiales archaeon]|nr:family 1 encapsulin nanocompartment shell protein [Methanomicrobiales archaeon]MDI6877036.1 family 1 encapsulin nanocompartment shell protein [Methanomicrobiales archaeon]
MNRYLSRGDAPIDGATWNILDATMVEAAKSILSGRRLLHLEGPFGLGLKAIPMTDRRDQEGLIVSSFVPLPEIHATFALGKRDLAAYERDRLLLDTAPVVQAALDVARREDNLIFHGGGGVTGLLNTQGSSSIQLSRWDTVGDAVDDIIRGVTRLDESGFHGPYALALAPSRFNLLYRRYEQGQMTELEHARTIVTEGIIKAPVLSDGGVLIASGRQYATIVIGQDMAVGFIGPAGENLEFSVSESLAPLVLQPKAICVLEG